MRTNTLVVIIKIKNDNFPERDRSREEDDNLPDSHHHQQSVIVIAEAYQVSPFVIQAEPVHTYCSRNRMILWFIKNIHFHCCIRWYSIRCHLSRWFLSL
jgi:hypothetical protein